MNYLVVDSKHRAYVRCLVNLVVGMALLLAGPWPVGLPVLVAGTSELVGALFAG